MLTVILAGLVPSIFATTIELILKTFPLDAAFDASCVALVPAATDSVLPTILVTLTILGFAMSTPYEPKIIANAMDLPAVMPEAAGAVDCHVVPFEVKTFPDVLGATNKGADVPLPRTTLLAVKVVAPVPPFATGKVPDT